jgi:hypothetical protein
MRVNGRLVFKMIVLATILVSSIAIVSAQQKQDARSNCPTLKVDCPSQAFVKDTLKFTAVVQLGDPKVSPTYNWTISAGTIEAGQGTSTIQVSTAGLDPESRVTATVELGGFDRGCAYGSTAASCSAPVVKKAEARKIDEYGKLTPKEEETRLDKFIIELKLHPTVQGYIVSYNARTGRPGDAQKAADRASIYLIRKRGLEVSRVVTVTGGSREQPTVELWLVPPGVRPPKPTAESNPATPTKTNN